MESAADQIKTLTKGTFVDRPNIGRIFGWLEVGEDLTSVGRFCFVAFFSVEIPALHPFVGYG